MLIPVKTKRIYQLPPVGNITELPGGLFEVEVLTGPVAGAYVNKKLTLEQLLAYLSDGLLTVDASLTNGQALPGSVAGVSAGVLYLLEGSGTGASSWNSSGDTETVAVFGLPGNRFASVGQLLVAGQPAQAVTVDVVAGTYELAAAGGSEYLDGDANGNVVVGKKGSSGLGVISSTGSGNLIENGNSNTITDGDFNTITGGEFSTISGGSGNSIIGGSTNTISGGIGNAISGGIGNTIPSSCSNVCLLNCQNFTAPAGATNATYLNNEPVASPGGTSGQLQYNNAGAFAGSVISQNGSGNIGVNKTAPLARLHVGGTGRIDGQLGVMAPTADSAFLLGVASDYPNYNALALNGVLSSGGMQGFFGGAATDPNLYFQGGGKTVFRQAGTGSEFLTGVTGGIYVGAGIETPVAALDVNGAIHLRPIPEPAAPSSGFFFYCDQADGKLYSKASSGNKIVLGTP